MSWGGNNQGGGGGGGWNQGGGGNNNNQGGNNNNQGGGWNQGGGGNNNQGGNIGGNNQGNQNNQGGPVPPYVTLGKAFLAHYYNTFDQNRQNCAKFYGNNSLMTFQTDKCQGRGNILKKLQGLNFQFIKHNPVNIDVQPDPRTVGQGKNPKNMEVIVCVTGTLKISDGEKQVYTYSDMFHLVPIEAADLHPMSREEHPISVAQRYSHLNDVPLEYPFTQNKRNHLFDFILHQYFFVDPSVREHNSRLFLERTSLLDLKDAIPKPDDKNKEEWESNHKLDFSELNDSLHKFLKLVNSILQTETLQNGLSKLKYEEFWKSVENKEFCTSLVVILLGRILKMEIDLLNKPFLSKKTPPTNDKVKEVMEFFNFKDGSWNDEAERLLEQRDVNLPKRVYMNSDLFGSFLQVYTQHSQKNYNTKIGGIIREAKIVDVAVLPTSGVSVEEQNKDLEFSEVESLERQGIINLLTYITTMYDFDYEERTLLKVVAECMKLRNGSSDLLTINKIPTAFGGSAGGSKQESMPTVLVDPVHKLFETCVDFESLEAMSLTHGTIIPPFHSLCPSGMLDAVNYFKLKHLFTVDAGNVLTIIIKHLNLPNANICNIFKFLKYLMKHLYLHRSYKQLLEIVNVCKKYFLEPMPVGGLARDLIIMCKKELSFPNFNMRRTFENLLDDKKESTREVHILFNPYSTNAKSIKRFYLDENGVEEPEEAMISVRANFILNIFAYHLNKGKDRPELIKLPPEVIAKFYKPITEYLETMYDLEPVDMREYVKQIRGKLTEFRTLVEKENPAGVEKIVSKFKRDWYPKMPHLRYKLIPLQKEESLIHTRRMRRTIPHTLYYKVLRKIILEKKKKKIEEDALKPETKVTTIAIAIAGGSGSVQRLAHAINTLNDSKVSLDVKLKVFLIPLGTNNLLGEWAAQNDPFYRRLFFNPIRNKIGVYPGLKKSCRPIKFSVPDQEETEGEDEMGGSGPSLSGPPSGSPQKASSEKINLEPGSLGSSQSRLFRELDENFYNQVAPVRTGYKPREDYMALLEEVEEHGGGDTQETFVYEPNFDICTPISFFTSLLRNYFISCTREIPICCYSAQCLRFQVMPNLMVIPKPLEMITMSFCQRVEIGYFAELMQYRKDNNLQKWSLGEVAERGFKFNPIALNISYVPMSISGDFLKSKKIQVTTKNYVSCQIKNISLCGDVGERVSPDQKSLQVYLEDTKKKKKKNERDYEKSFRAAEISVESPNHVSFSVLFDGELYGPFHRILINSYKGDQFFLQSMS